MPPPRAPTTNRPVARQTARARPGRPPAPTTGRRLIGGKRGQGLATLLRELRGEIRKVVWPTRKEVMNLTAVVVALSAALGAFLGGIDFIFQEFFRFVLRITGAGGY
jgi:preprotein translocase subunit SecE